VCRVSCVASWRVGKCPYEGAPANLARARVCFEQTSRRARDRIMGVIAPVKPTGGAIGIATVVAFAGAAACTQFLSLNMPFGA